MLDVYSFVCKCKRCEKEAADTTHAKITYSNKKNKQTATKQKNNKNEKKKVVLPRNNNNSSGGGNVVINFGCLIDN